MRKVERKAVDEAVRLHPNDWSSLEVRLIDCSEAGFRARSEARIRNCDEVTLEVPGVGPAKAYVTWVRGEEFGARFAEPIPFERAALTPIGEEQRLARLLVQRADAQRSGLWDQEERLRREITHNLPVKRS